MHHSHVLVEAPRKRKLGVSDEVVIHARSPFSVLWFILTPLAVAVVGYYYWHTRALEVASRSYNPLHDFERLEQACVALSSTAVVHATKGSDSYVVFSTVVADAGDDVLTPVATWTWRENCEAASCGARRHRVGDRLPCWRALPTKLDSLFRDFFQCGSPANNPRCYLRSDPAIDVFAVDTDIYASSLGVLALLSLLCVYTCCTQQREQLQDAREALRTSSPRALTRTESALSANNPAQPPSPPRLGRSLSQLSIPGMVRSDSQLASPGMVRSDSLAML